MRRTWIDGPLVASYVIGEVIVGQVVEQTGNGGPRTWANFDLSKVNESRSGPLGIGDGYTSVELARAAMERYWAAMEPMGFEGA